MHDMVDCEETMWNRRKGHKSKPTTLSSIVEVELDKFATPTSPVPLPFPIRRAWLVAVGDRVSKRAMPMKVSSNGKTLVVRVLNSSWMAELQMLVPTILIRLREGTGLSKVESIRFELGKLPNYRSTMLPVIEREPTPPMTGALPKAINEALDDVENPELRAQMEIAYRRLTNKEEAE
jgi:hypothetical protein